MGSSGYVGVIRIEERLKEGGYWLLTSQDLPGLVLCGKDLDTLRIDTPAVIKALYKTNFTMDVQVVPAGSPKEITAEQKQCAHFTRKEWAAIPQIAA